MLVTIRVVMITPGDDDDGDDDNDNDDDYVEVGIPIPINLQSPCIHQYSTFKRIYMSYCIPN